MIRYLVVLCVAALAVAGAGRATVAQDAQGGQILDPAYVQIEARPTLQAAEREARAYSHRLTGVNGFSLGNGYYAVVLGPFEGHEAAEQAMARLLSQNAIPRDSYITYPAFFGQQFWPVAAQQAATTPPASPSGSGTTVTYETTNTSVNGHQGFTSTLPDETVSEARQSEARLSAAERDQLQQALKAEGFYDGAIDGAFGTGTRRSMGAWQSAHGYSSTGILTTAQRKELVDNFNSVLSDLGMTSHTDARAGISMQMPMGVLKFDKYDPPFAIYKSSGNLGARVILISEPGDRDTLGGLYEVLQTLAVVPADGRRKLTGNNFSIEGHNSRIATYAQASLKGNQIKGFILVWPEGDEARRTRLVDAMRVSFSTLPGILKQGAQTEDDSEVDLVSGLQVSKPKVSRSGVFVSQDGAVLTVADAVQSCGKITINGDYPAQVAATDPTNGLALLKPSETLAPTGVAKLTFDTPASGQKIAVSGYSYEGVLGAPSMTYGTLEGLTGLDGEAGVDRLKVSTLPGDAGGPVFDASGAMIGLLQTKPDGSRKLPDDVAFATDASRLVAMLRKAGLSPTQVGNLGGQSLKPISLDRQAASMTVLVECWN